MQGAIDSALLEQASASSGKVDVQITKPNLIDYAGRGTIVRAATSIVALNASLSIHVSELAAAELHSAITGFEGKDTLENGDLVQIGGRVLGEMGIKKD